MSEAVNTLAHMLHGNEIFQMAIAVLSVPAVAAFTTRLSRRFSKEARLLIRLERVAAICPNLPRGAMKEEFGARVSEATEELNARLDPLFRRERRRKRTVIIWIAAVASVVLLVFPGQEVLGTVGSNLVSVVVGGIAVVAFLYIERDTRRQRAAIHAETGKSSSA